MGRRCHDHEYDHEYSSLSVPLAVFVRRQPRAPLVCCRLRGRAWAPWLETQRVMASVAKGVTPELNKFQQLALARGGEFGGGWGSGTPSASVAACSVLVLRLLDL